MGRTISGGVDRKGRFVKTGNGKYRSRAPAGVVILGIITIIGLVCTGVSAILLNSAVKDRYGGIDPGQVWRGRALVDGTLAQSDSRVINSGTVEQVRWHLSAQYPDKYDGAKPDGEADINTVLETTRDAALDSGMLVLDEAYASEELALAQAGTSRKVCIDRQTGRTVADAGIPSYIIIMITSSAVILLAGAGGTAYKLTYAGD